MKRSELEKIIAEELTNILGQLSEIAVRRTRSANYGKKNVKRNTPVEKQRQKFTSAGTVPKIHNRKMTKDQIKKRKEIGKKIINAMRRGKKANNKIYQSLLRRAKRYSGGSNPSQKQLFSYAWAMASDLAIKGGNFTTAKKPKTPKKPKKPTTDAVKQKKSKKSGETK